jgi:hypothetical protein
VIMMRFLPRLLLMPSGFVLIAILDVSRLASRAASLGFKSCCNQFIDVNSND